MTKLPAGRGNTGTVAFVDLPFFNVYVAVIG